jgi:H+/Cl- antiporter ClcA
MSNKINIANKAAFILLKQLVRWVILILPIAFAIGSVIALFLWLLAAAIQYRFNHKWLLFLLPLAGLLIHFIYQTIGKSSEKGNSLIMDEIHQEGAGVPKQMAPVILVTTILTHLFGGSAGREGTAVQIGGSMAAMYGNWLKLDRPEMRIILTAGIAAGFGAVFGTPMTGAIFALEVLTIGKIKYNLFVPALIAGLVGDFAVRAWHVSHVHYHIDSLSNQNSLFAKYLHLDPLLLAKVVVAAVLFGATSFLFSTLVKTIKRTALFLFKRKWMIPVVGGLAIIALTSLLGKPDYLSLGVQAEYPGAVTISSAFQHGGAQTWSWLWKMVYTSITLGTGFKGGEVTPLFYIGATLGNTLAEIMNAPAGLFAALGFIAVFAGATKTPIACTFMGIELFGGHYALLFSIACFTAYICSGHTGIYESEHLDPGALRSRGYLQAKFDKYQLLKRKKD